MSAAYIQLYSSALQTRFYNGSYELQREQSEQGPYCLQYRLPKNINRRGEQMTKVVVGGKRVLKPYMHSFSICQKSSPGPEPSSTAIFYSCKEWIVRPDCSDVESRLSLLWLPSDKN